MNLVALSASRITAKVREVGIREAARLALRALMRQYRDYCWRREEEAFDRLHGTVTGYRPEDDAPCSAYRSAGNQGYDPVRVRTLRRALNSLPIRYEEFVFVDVGSGKGRAVFVAAGFPFRKVLGIEIDGNLHETARRNLARGTFPSRKCSEIELIQSDALNMDFVGNRLILHVFNPFGRPCVEAFLRRVRSALAGSLAEVYIIYGNPLHQDLLDNSGFLQLTAEEQGYDEYTQYCIYSNTRPVAQRTRRGSPVSFVRRCWARAFGTDRVDVKRSAGKGIGVFAARAYARGERILPIRGKPVAARGEYTIQIESNRHIEPRVPERLVNHSCDPNAGIRVDGRGMPAFYARRPIQPGEEITWDYAMAESDFRIDGVEQGFVCRCGAVRCRGRVEGGWGRLPEEIRMEYQDWCMPYLKRESSRNPGPAA